MSEDATFVIIEGLPKRHSWKLRRHSNGRIKIVCRRCGCSQMAVRAMGWDICEQSPGVLMEKRRQEIARYQNTPKAQGFRGVSDYDDLMRP